MAKPQVGGWATGSFVLLEWWGRPSNSSLFNLLRSEAGLLKGDEK
jgi:hypothetical protein